MFIIKKLIIRIAAIILPGLTKQTGRIMIYSRFMTILLTGIMNQGMKAAVTITGSTAFFLPAKE